MRARLRNSGTVHKTPPTPGRAEEPSHHEKLPLDNPSRQHRRSIDSGNHDLRHGSTSPRNTHRRHPTRSFRHHRHDNRPLHNRRRPDINRNGSTDRKGVPPQASQQRLKHTSPKQAGQNQKEQPKQKNNSPPGFKSQKPLTQIRRKKQNRSTPVGVGRILPHPPPPPPPPLTPPLSSCHRI